MVFVPWCTTALIDNIPVGLVTLFLLIEGQIPQEIYIPSDERVR